MKKLFISIILIILAILLVFLVFPFGMIWQIKSYFKKKENYIYLSSILFSIAQCIDQLGNVIFQELFNDLLITKNGYKFGNHQETISSVIGKNFEKGTLTKTGLWLNNILNKIEPNHTIISIENNVSSQ